MFTVVAVNTGGKLELDRLGSVRFGPGRFEAPPEPVRCSRIEPPQSWSETALRTDSGRDSNGSIDLLSSRPVPLLFTVKVLVVIDSDWLEQ